MSHDVVQAEVTRPPVGLPVLIEARGVGKRYPGVIALDGVDIKLRAGEIHALLGENGAGKSTLIGLLSGISTPDSGELFVDGVKQHFNSAKQAQALGISTIYQEQTLAPDLTVVQNVYFGRELRRGLLLDEGAMRRRVESLCGEFGLTAADLDSPVGALGALKQHVVQILKALAFDARVVILDEPTSGLEESERQLLFEHMGRLRDRGVALLWVTHRLDELFGLADVITVLRDSRLVASVNPAEHSPDSLVRLMVGRKRPEGEYLRVHDRSERIQSNSREEFIRLEHVSRYPLLRDISLSIRRGEILGLAGIAGAGRTELGRIILGADRPDSGSLFLDGKEVTIRSPRHATGMGISMVPEERKTQSILGTMSIAKNISITDLGKVSRNNIVLDRGRENRLAKEAIRDLGIKSSSEQQKIVNLSGGNQQKAIVARCLFSGPSLMIFDEPTQGVDVAAKTDIYRLIYDFVDKGGAAVVISSELPELLHLSDRIAVMREGRLVGELAGVDRPGCLGPESEIAETIMAMAARETGHSAAAETKEETA